MQRLVKMLSQGECSEEMASSPYLHENEIARALFDLQTNRSPDFFQEALGFIPLFGKSFFPWGALPYPYEHAILGKLLTQLGQSEKAKRMAAFQNATLDHHLKPIGSLFRQEVGVAASDLEVANREYFEVIGQKPEVVHQFVDERLALVADRGENHTVVCLGTGCKSGMGVFLFEDVGVLNYGPQILPEGSGESFGLAGRATETSFARLDEGFTLKFTNKIASPHPRETGFPWLRDAGYSRGWIRSELHYTPYELMLFAEIEGGRPLTDFLFCFFVQAKACVVSKSHKLNPRSLDRYSGPVQSIALKGSQSEMILEAKEGMEQMKVIPLAGDEGYWGADFMICYKPLSSFHIHIKTEKVS